MKGLGAGAELPQFLGKLLIAYNSLGRRLKTKYHRGVQPLVGFNQQMNLERRHEKTIEEDMGGSVRFFHVLLVSTGGARCASRPHSGVVELDVKPKNSTRCLPVAHGVKGTFPTAMNLWGLRKAGRANTRQCQVPEPDSQAFEVFWAT